MIGLPNENEKDIENTVEFLNGHKIDGIKLHSLFVLKGTAMEKLYLDGNYTPITRDYYIKSVGYILSRLPSSVVVHRLTGDGEKAEILAPEWTKEKKKNLNAITKFMLENGITQGCFYKGK
jgi:radical SAM superfamily enzyme